MQVEKRIANHGFQWHFNTKSKIIGTLEKSELRKENHETPPLFWLKILEGEGLNCEVYFVNSSEYTIKRIKPISSGYISYDDNLVPLQNNNTRYYIDIKPNEAILVDTFNKMYDSDSYLSLSLQIDSEITGNVQIATPSFRGKIPEQAIYFEKTGFAKNISIEE